MVWNEWSQVLVAVWNLPTPPMFAESFSVKPKDPHRTLSECYYLSFPPIFLPTQTFSKSRLCIPRRWALSILYLVSLVPWNLDTWPRAWHRFSKKEVCWIELGTFGQVKEVSLGWEGALLRHKGSAHFRAPSQMTEKSTFGERGLKSWSLGASVLPSSFSLQLQSLEGFTSGCQRGSPNQEVLQVEQSQAG